MKCPSCWSEKAYRRKPKNSLSRVRVALGIVNFKCHHCFHEFARPLFMTLGQPLDAPTPKEGKKTVYPSVLDLEKQPSKS